MCAEDEAYQSVGVPMESGEPDSYGHTYMDKSQSKVIQKMLKNALKNKVQRRVVKQVKTRLRPRAKRRYSS